MRHLPHLLRSKWPGEKDFIFDSEAVAAQVYALFTIGLKFAENGCEIAIY